MGTKHIFTRHQPYSDMTIKVSYPGRHGDTFLCPLVSWREEPEVLLPPCGFFLDPLSYNCQEAPG